MTLGLAETGTAWRLAAPLWALPRWPGEVFEAAAALSFAFWLALLLYKWAVHRPLAVAEWQDPVQGSFLALVPESVLLLAIAALPYGRGPAVVLFWIGSVSNLVMGAWRLSSYWRCPREAAQLQPPMLLTFTASVLVNALAAGLLQYTAYGWALLGIGALSWSMLDPAIARQLMTAPLPARSRNFMGIYMAPPVVALVAVQVLADGAAPLALVAALAGYALFVSAALLLSWRWLREQPFAAGYWAYTFGVATLAQGLAMMASRWPSPALSVLAAVGLVASLALTLAVAAGSARLVRTGRYLPPPAPPVPQVAPVAPVAPLR